MRLRLAIISSITLLLLNHYSRLLDYLFTTIEILCTKLQSTECAPGVPSWSHDFVGAAGPVEIWLLVGKADSGRTWNSKLNMRWDKIKLTFRLGERVNETFCSHGAMQLAGFVLIYRILYSVTVTNLTMISSQQLDSDLSLNSQI
jgi:hypothetical protein